MSTHKSREQLEHIDKAAGPRKNQRSSGTGTTQRLLSSLETFLLFSLLTFHFIFILCFYLTNSVCTDIYSAMPALIHVYIVILLGKFPYSFLQSFIRIVNAFKIPSSSLRFRIDYNLNLSPSPPLSFTSSPFLLFLLFFPLQFQKLDMDSKALNMLGEYATTELALASLKC